MFDKKDKFYVTTPIYYGNGVPHIGHAYSSIIANIIYKYHKISGKRARFTTGIDENSQKAIIKAEETGMKIMEYLDMMASKHKKVWDFFEIGYTDFIRTTESRHHKLVQEVLSHCFDKGDIYEGKYEGLYCIGCEAFKKESDLVPMEKETGLNGILSSERPVSNDIKMVCPDHLKEPDKIKEKNYFFRLTNYQKWLEEFYEANPSFVNPDFRFNEVKAFVNRGLEDFSISRETNTFGIPLPFDKSQVTYVWFDALFNYYTSCKYSRGGNKNNKVFIDESDIWPADLHIVGKDIIRFHAIYWPCMLASYLDLGEKDDNGIIRFKSSDLDKLPRQILTGGYFTVDGQKMSKSIGNVIEPVEYANKYSKELLILYMLSAFPIGNDGDYDRKDAILTYNSKLANNLGNLVNRGMVLKLKIPQTISFLGEKETKIITDEDIQKKINGFLEKIEKSMKNYDLKNTLDVIFAFLDEINKYVDEKEPWNLIKDDSKKEETIKVVYTILESLRIVGLCLYPFFPKKMGEMFKKLGLKNYVEDLENGKLEELRNKNEIFDIKEKGNPLFDRLDLIEENSSQENQRKRTVKISINPDLQKEGIKVKGAIFRIPQITKKRSAELKKYIENSLSSLNKDKIINSNFIKRSKEYYDEAGLIEALHPAESLLSLVEKNGNLPNINKVVDSYNIITLEEVISVGVHDIDKISGNVRFDYTTGEEHYIPLTKIEEVKVGKGEYACLDDEKILCRMDLKQCDETKISENTKTMLIYVQGNSEVSEEYIENGLKKVCDSIIKFAGGEYEEI